MIFLSIFSLNIPRYFLDRYHQNEIGYFGILAMPITVLALVITFLLQPKIIQLTALFTNKEIIIDPGFGFAKTIEQNYELLRNLCIFETFNMPILVGVSRKSMIYKLLNSSPEESLNATSAAHMLALEQGVHILRVHDVKPAMEVIALYKAYKGISQKQNGH